MVILVDQREGIFNVDVWVEVAHVWDHSIIKVFEEGLEPRFLKVLVVWVTVQGFPKPADSFLIVPDGLDLVVIGIVWVKEGVLW